MSWWPAVPLESARRDLATYIDQIHRQPVPIADATSQVRAVLVSAAVFDQAYGDFDDDKLSHILLQSRAEHAGVWSETDEPTDGSPAQRGDDTPRGDRPVRPASTRWPAVPISDASGQVQAVLIRMVLFDVAYEMLEDFALGALVMKPLAHDDGVRIPVQYVIDEFVLDDDGLDPPE